MISGNPILVVLAACAAILVIIATFKRLSLGMAFLLSALPVFALTRKYFSVGGFPPPITFETAAVLSVYAVDLMRRILRGFQRNRLDRPLAVCIAVFLSAGIVSSVASRDPQLSLRILLSGGVVPIMVFSLVRDSVQEEMDVHRIVLGLLVLAFQLSLYSLLNYANLRDQHYAFATDDQFLKIVYQESPILNLFVVPSVTSGIVVAIFPLVFAHMIMRGMVHRVFAIIVFVSMMFMGALSLSRGSWVGVIAVLFMCLPLLRRNLDMGVLILVSLVLISVYASGFFGVMLNALQVRVDSGYMDSSTIVRLENYKLALYSAKDFWLHGLGLGRYSDIYWLYPHHPASFYPALWFAHSLFLTLIPEIGVVGTVALAVFILYICARVVRSMQVNNPGMQDNIMYACVAGISGYVVVASTTGSHLIAYLANPPHTTFFMAPATIVVFALLGVADALVLKRRGWRI